jgi:hypothetical protein
LAVRGVRRSGNFESGAFRFRWHVELDIRAIKQTIRHERAAAARRRRWCAGKSGYLLAYNLIHT